ncbi:hypothetical protein ElyMa_003922900 [Elysia marginata]|uniref:Uncharacterized protein n=1 Tax=Elysia marginata TaxID=1093978 RepID=A0AAV4FR10_9GAST|nr:hypothetical protein ElyMa_003922900 [Elysia marginata]
MISQSEAGIPLGRLFGQSEAGIPLARITLGKRGESLAPQIAVTEAPLFPKVIRASGIPASDWPKSRPSGISASDWLFKAHRATRANDSHRAMRPCDAHDARRERASKSS